MSTQRVKVHVQRMMRVFLALGVALASSPVHAGKPIPPAGPPVKYTMTLVPLNNVVGMNNFGDIVDGGVGLYDHLTGRVYDLSAAINALLVTDVVASVVDINDSWKIAGAYRGADGVLRAFRCSIGFAADGTISATALERLPELDGYPWGLPAAINNSGDVVGQAETSDNPPDECRAVVWPSVGGVVQLATVFSAAHDISDNGYVTGFMYRGPEQRAFLFDPASGKTSDLGVLPRRTASFGYAVNSSGQVAGKSNGGGRTQHSFRYTPGVGMVDLGTIGGYDFGYHAASLNAAGQVVGTAVTRINNPFSTTGFLYTDANKMLDLAPLIANPPASLKYLEPRVVNDYPGHGFGQIAGIAYVNEQPAVILLTPDR